MANVHEGHKPSISLMQFISAEIAIAQGCCCTLVKQTITCKSSNFCWIEECLPLNISEIGRHGEHDPFGRDFFLLKVFVEFLKVACHELLNRQHLTIRKLNAKLLRCFIHDNNIICNEFLFEFQLLCWSACKSKESCEVQKRALWVALDLTVDWFTDYTFLRCLEGKTHWRLPFLYIVANYVNSCFSRDSKHGFMCS